jgi:hypothetical protein
VNADFRRRFDGGIFVDLPVRRQLLETIHWALCVGRSRKQSEKQEYGPGEHALSPIGIPACKLQYAKE